MPHLYYIALGVAGALAITALVKKEWTPLTPVGLLLVVVALIIGPGK